MRVLLVEDNALTGERIRSGLIEDGYAVDWVLEGRMAELAVASERYALVLLDLGLPRKDGFAVLARLRQRDDRIPVLIIGAPDAATDRVQGLDSDVDDYPAQPFDLDELAVRARAVLRREAGRGDTVVFYGPLMLNLGTNEVFYYGRAVSVTAREFNLLHALFERPGVALSRADLEDRLFGWGGEATSDAVEKLVRSLRRKFGSGFIRHIRGVGYTIGRIEAAAV
ncbi:MAG: response regulator transcription factor [Burkholderiales bacterium]|nr:response regulator transcription factor [Burkholderiales bacterium]